MTHPVTRGHARMKVTMENNNDSNSSASETSESFVVRMWQEDPGEWRGTVRHVQSQAQLGFTRVEQATRFIQEHSTGVETRAAAKSTAKAAAVHLDLRMSRRTTRMLAFALAIIILSIVGLVAAAQGNVSQLLGFGH